MAPELVVGAIKQLALSKVMRLYTSLFPPADETRALSETFLFLQIHEPVLPRYLVY
jgi:hypothetical protein